MEIRENTEASKKKKKTHLLRLSTRIASDFSSKTTEGRREWSEMFSVERKTQKQTISLELCILSNYFSTVKEKDFLKQTKRNLLSSKPALPEMLKFL